MFLLAMKYTYSDKLEPIAICKTEKLAKEYITKKMEGFVYSGIGNYTIIELPVVKTSEDVDKLLE